MPALVRPRHRHRLLLALLLAVLPALAGTPAQAGGVPESTSASTAGQLALFASGTAGYGCFRVPALVRTAAGTLLAFAEGRKEVSCGDRGDTDLVVRRSTDDGRTWGPVQVVPAGATAPGSYGPGGPPAGTGTGAGAPVTRGNAAPVVDAASGRVYLLSTSNPADSSYPRTPWSQYSTDDGRTWSDPEPLAVTLRGTAAGSDWFATGPGHGIQLTEGPHAGRLVVGAHQVTRAGGDYAGYLYLDPAPDGSGTWRVAGAVDSHAAATPAQPAEAAVAETAGGGVRLVARNSGAPARVEATAATPAGDAVPAVPAFRAAAIPSAGDVQGSLLRLHSAAADGAEHLLLAAPAGPGRTGMTLWSACGAGWQPTGTQVSTGPAGYSDLALLRSDEIGLLYEGGATGSADEIRFTHLAESALGAPCGIPARPDLDPARAPAPAPSTPDVSAEGADAALTGTAALSAAGGPAGSLDHTLAPGTSGAADLPPTAALDPGAGDVTYSLWFRYQAAPGDPVGALLWAYGYGKGAPQVWLRARPGSDDLYAAVAGAGGAAYVSARDTSAATAFGDGQWHHATLTRAGSRATLGVDEGTAHAVTATAGGVAGPLAAPVAAGPDGIRIGGRQGDTAAEPFTGAIDEFRLYRAALSPAEAAGLGRAAASGDPLGDAADAALAARLPFQVTDTPLPAARATVAGVDDEAEGCSDAWLLGGRGTAVASAGGQALRVDAAHPGAEAPLGPQLDLGAGDFTFSLWFSYRSAAGGADQALLWAYGLGADQPQLWVQAQPGTDRLSAMVQTDSGARYLAVQDPTPTAGFGDGSWHQVVLRRSGGQVRLTVDDSAALTASATGLAGSLTAARADGIRGLRIGSRPDGAKVLGGLVDEFRLYRSALDQTALDTVYAGGGLGAGSGIAVRYSFDGKYTYSAAATRPLPDATPATPDLSPRCNNAYLTGGAHVAAGQRSGGGALLLGGTGGALVPRSASLTAGGGDLTVTAWFRYRAGTADQVLLWADGYGTYARQFWVRAQPSADRLYAVAQTDTGQVRLAATDTSAATAFGDGAWHELALVRGAGSLQLAVDGQVLASAPLAAGSLTRTDTYAADGLHLGAAPDGTGALTGAMDDVRVFPAALTAGQLAALHTTGAAPGALPPVLWLPFDIAADRSSPQM
ncbi:LamG-like jellyroll fold domain-containing protein [Actinacidiphila epipremni]|uniref:exo-alpha-sialidase n=1 Tax=Actinacidiphila epipremni TaxID=2053013 RepID=A0ABX0ZQU3_9ACTN|nr:LamG-like jellyroll fold domain-containing protein [Actinacidiphila epipremni]NJP45390.1 neuraminidase [Actinacidiphila epipremni]